MSDDFLPIKGYDHVEFYVGNAKQAAHFYDKTFGFRPLAKAGLETGVRDRACYVMEQGDIRFVFTSAYGPDHEIARHCALHGDGVKFIGLSVSDVERALAETKKRGATVLQPVTAAEDEHGTFVTGAICFWSTSPHMEPSCLYRRPRRKYDRAGVGFYARDPHYPIFGEDAHDHRFRPVGGRRAIDF